VNYIAAMVVLDISDITNLTWRSTYWVPIPDSNDALSHIAFLADGTASLSVDQLGPWMVNITTDAPTDLFQGIFEANSKLEEIYS
jgi:hypothetical protein